MSQGSQASLQALRTMQAAIVALRTAVVYAAFERESCEMGKRFITVVTSSKDCRLSTMKAMDCLRNGDLIIGPADAFSVVTSVDRILMLTEEMVQNPAIPAGGSSRMHLGSKDKVAHKRDTAAASTEQAVFDLSRDSVIALQTEISGVCGLISKHLKKDSSVATWTTPAQGDFASTGTHTLPMEVLPAQPVP